jgi:hypothetical protein
MIQEIIINAKNVPIALIGYKEARDAILCLADVAHVFAIVAVDVIKKRVT